MSKTTLFVANLAASTEIESLQELFAEHGEVESLELQVDEKRDMRYLVVDMATEKTANRANHAINGLQVDGNYLSVSPAEPDTSRRLMNKQRKVADKIVKDLGETEKVPLRQIEAMVLLCGTSFAEAILKETNEIEEQGGIKTTDGERRRTKGGVFFYLARFRMSQPMRSIIYNRKGKLPQEEDADAQEVEQEN